MIGRARPAIVLRASDDSGPDGIALDVTDRLPQVACLDRHGVAPPVPQIFRNLVPLTKRFRVFGKGLGHRPGNRLAIFWDRDHMDVVSHESVGPYFQTRFPRCRVHDAEEAAVIGVVPEDGLVGAASGDDVVGGAGEKSQRYIDH